MGSRPTVSVITPAYNRAGTLALAIESVLDQTWQDFELILVDDASTDGTLRVMERYRRLDPRIRVVRNERRSRGGPIEWEPRNDGLRVAQGEFVAYLDSDNEWKPPFLERLLAFIWGDPGLQLVHCDSRNHYPPGQAERIIQEDVRMLVEAGEDWTVFSYGALDPAGFGAEVSVDTNEMLHRASVFRTLRSLWHTEHPRRAEITALEPVDRPMRRHNDMDLVERIVAAFGLEALGHLREVLVDFYYEGAARRSGVVSIRPAEAARPPRASNARSDMATG